MQSGTVTDNVRASLWAQIRSFGRPFWMANVMELLERLAYYGVKVVVPIYIASSADPGGLHFTNTQKGTIFTAWALVQSLLPMFTGGFADRYGNKRTISVAIVFKIVGYLMMATQRGYALFFVGCIFLAVGTAVFKPGVQGTLLRGISKTNASVGWGLFYQCVNIGGALGPMLAGALRRLAWPYVFYSCAAIVSLNFVSMLFYDDNPVDLPSSPTGGPSDNAPSSAYRVLVDSIARMFTPRLLAFILVTSGFWLMFMQLFDMLPNFIEEWTDSSGVAHFFHIHPGSLAQMTPRGLQIDQEHLINVDALCIIVFMVFIAALTARIPRIASMALGTLVATVGLAMTGLSMSGWWCLLGITVFAFGEMAASPKMNEYLGVIAPRGQESLYMGYANVPIAIGWSFGDAYAGVIYDHGADKANLSLRWLRSHGVSMSVPEAMLHPAGNNTVPVIGTYLRNHGMPVVAAHVRELDAAHGTVTTDSLSTLFRLHAFEQMQATAGIHATEATDILWRAYHPYAIWYAFIFAGALTSVAMVVYGKVATRWGAEG